MGCLVLLCFGGGRGIFIFVITVLLDYSLLFNGISRFFAVVDPIYFGMVFNKDFFFRYRVQVDCVRSFDESVSCSMV